ncbi:MAG: hypothetical protein ACTSRU_13625 [Candidatus Hodarchaeales archaeon]
MEQSNFNELKIKINRLIQDTDIFFVYGIIFVTILTFSLCYLDLWGYYFLIAIIGGMIAGYKKEKQGMIVGSLGVALGASIYLNFSIITSIGAWDLLIDLIFGFTGSGIIGILLAYLIMLIIGGLSGYTGALSIPVIQLLISKILTPAQEKNNGKN